MINWQYFPKSDQCPAHLKVLVRIFESVADDIDSATHATQESNDVLRVVRPRLEPEGYLVESGKKTTEKIPVPVLFGPNGKIEKSFNADAWNRATNTVLEVEAGRAFANNQFLKDLFQACMMNDVDYLAVAVRNVYKASRDWEQVRRFFETMYASRRLVLPLSGILVIGY